MTTTTLSRPYHPKYKAELIIIFDKCKLIGELCKTLNRSIAWINKIHDCDTIKLKMNDKIPSSLKDKIMNYWFGELPSLSEEEKFRYKLKLQSQNKLKRDLTRKKRGSKQLSVYDKVSMFGVKSIKYYPAGGKKNK